MTSPATSSHLPALAEPHELEAIAHELEAIMQQLVASWRDLADVVAERAVALGHVPDGQARAVTAGSPLSAVTAEATESHAVVRAITDRIAQVSEIVRERMSAQLSDRA